MHLRKTFSLLVFFSFLASAQTPPDARTLLKEAQGALGKYKSYVIEQRTVIDMQGPTKARTEMSTKMAMSAPGKMRIESNGQAGALIVSDGENTWMYLAPLKQYTKTAAATSPEALVKSLIPGIGDVFEQLKSKDPYLSAKLAGEDVVEVDGKKSDCYVVETTLVNLNMPGSLTMTDGIQKIWIDKDSKVTLKMTMSATMQGGPLPEAMHMNMALTVISRKVNEPVPDSMFTFTPPEGAKEVKEFSMGVMPRADLSGKVAADFKLKSIDGKEYSLQALRGKVVLLDFWATWCGPCRMDLPMLEKLHQQFKSQGLVLLGLNVGEDWETVAKFLGSAKLSYPVVLTADTTVCDDYKVTAYPTVVVIDREGKIVLYHTGAGREKELRESLVKLGIETPAK